MAEKYDYCVVWSEEDKEFVGLCSKFPSLSWLADSREAALNGIVKLVAEVVAEVADPHQTWLEWWYEKAMK